MPQAAMLRSRWCLPGPDERDRLIFRDDPQALSPGPPAGHDDGLCTGPERGAGRPAPAQVVAEAERNPDVVFVATPTEVVMVMLRLL